MEYKVTWEIDVDADSPREAAEKAEKFQKEGRGVFQVHGEAIPLMGIQIDLESPACPCGKYDEDNCEECEEAAEKVAAK